MREQLKRTNWGAGVRLAVLWLVLGVAGASVARGGDLFRWLLGPEEEELATEALYVWNAGLGFSETVPEIRSEQWYPVWVRIEGKRKGVQGTLTLRQEGNELVVTQPVDVPRGTTKLYQTFYYVKSLEGIGPGGSTLDVTLSMPGMEPETSPLPLRASRLREGIHVLLLGEKVTSFHGVTGEGEFETELERAVEKSMEGSFHFSQGEPMLLPEDPLMLGGLDAIMIDGDVAREIGPAQWRAIEAWTAAGGQLMLAAGRHAALIKESALAAPFGEALPAAEPARWEEFDLRPEQATGGGGGGEAEQVLATSIAADAPGWVPIETERGLIRTRKIDRGRFHLLTVAMDADTVATMVTGERRSGLLQRAVAAQ